ncbi:hypothetical protein tb265_20290 [Gemmatimonadetes bacterium T265]|nr:hypothetical protein tb265_20290 [Gemmatimonadetes bacterium T265]
MADRTGGTAGLGGESGDARPRCRPAGGGASAAPALPRDGAKALLAPYRPEAMRAYPVSRLVNDPRHDMPDVIAPSPSDV